MRKIVSGKDAIQYATYDQFYFATVDKLKKQYDDILEDDSKTKSQCHTNALIASIFGKFKDYKFGNPTICFGITPVVSFFDDATQEQIDNFYQKADEYNLDIYWAHTWLETATKVYDLSLHDEIIEYKKKRFYEITKIKYIKKLKTKKVLLKMKKKCCEVFEVDEKYDKRNIYDCSIERHNEINDDFEKWKELHNLPGVRRLGNLIENVE